MFRVLFDQSRELSWGERIVLRELSVEGELLFAWTDGMVARM